MRKLTYEQLVKAKACSEQRVFFRSRYGYSVLVTVEAAQEAAQLFDWVWASRNLLSPAAREAYRATVAPAWEAYRAADDSAYDAYFAATDSAWAAYKAATDSARAALKVAQAKAFATAYIADESK